MKKIGIFMILVGFICLAVAAIATLTLDAKPTTTISAEAKWAYVCCGAACAGGEDICHGDGRYSCCK